MPYSPGANRVYYEIHGAAGPAVVLLHGLGSAGDDWPLQVPAFAASHRVITVDAPGHGRSDPLRAASIPAMASPIADLLAYLGEPPAHLVGLSLGGCLALQMAIRRPEAVRSLVLVNTFARLQPAGLRGLLRFARRLWLLSVAPMNATAGAIAAGLFPGPHQRELYEAALARLAANSKETYWRSIRALLAFDVSASLPNVLCPALVIAGDRDQTIPLAAKQRLAAGIPGARLVVVPDSGHATPYDQSEAFNRLVLDFVNGIEAGNKRN